MDWLSLWQVVWLSATALMLASVGEVITERAGVLNLGIEGMMAAGGLVAFLVNREYGWLPAIMASIAAGVFMGLCFWWLAVYRAINQVLIGIVIAFTLVELVNLVGQNYINQQSSKMAAEPFALGAVVLAGLAGVLLSKTTFGLSLRAVGEYPDAIHYAGVNVYRTRLWAVTIGTVLMSLAGAQLALVMLRGTWVSNITGGKGWLAYAIAVFSGWKPKYAVLGALLFGAASSAQFWLQGAGWNIPPSLLGTLPFVLAIVAYTFGRAKAPAALSVPWRAPQ